MRHLTFVPLLLVIIAGVCRAEDCFPLRGKITPSFAHVFALKTALEMTGSEFEKCQEQVSSKNKNGSKYRDAGLAFPITLEVNQGKLSARCNCRELIFGGGDVDQIQYQFEMAECYSKAMANMKLPSSDGVAKICWDGKFPIGTSGGGRGNSANPMLKTGTATPR